MGQVSGQLQWVALTRLRKPRARRGKGESGTTQGL